MSSKQRRIKRKLKIIKKTYDQYVLNFNRNNMAKADAVFTDHDHRSRTLHAKHGESLNIRWIDLCCGN